MPFGLFLNVLALGICRASSGSLLTGSPEVPHAPTRVHHLKSFVWNFKGPNRCGGHHGLGILEYNQASWNLDVSFCDLRWVGWASWLCIGHCACCHNLFCVILIHIHSLELNHGPPYCPQACSPTHAESDETHWNETLLVDQDSLHCRMWIKMNQLYQVIICSETDSTFIGNCHYNSMGITFGAIWFDAWWYCRSRSLFVVR